MKCFGQTRRVSQLTVGYCHVCVISQHHNHQFLKTSRQHPRLQLWSGNVDFCSCMFLYVTSDLTTQAWKLKCERLRSNPSPKVTKLNSFLCLGQLSKTGHTHSSSSTMRTFYPTTPQQQQQKVKPWRVRSWFYIPAPSDTRVINSLHLSEFQKLIKTRNVTLFTLIVS